MEAARRKVREIIDAIPQRGQLGIVERWRQLPDGLIEFTMRRLPTPDQSHSCDAVTVNRGSSKMLDITERARTIVAEQLAVDPDQVVNDANFIDDLGADSLDMVELAIKFEREFGFEISDDAVECIATVGDAVKFLEKNAFT